MTSRLKPDRRAFLCWCCVGAATLIADGAGAQTGALPGVVTKELSRNDVPGGKYVTLVVQVDIPAGLTVPRHTHPGTEDAVVISGGGEWTVKGSAARMVKAGETWHAPADTPHAFKNGNQVTSAVLTRVLDKDKPVTTLTPE